ncbi:hypothetical protein BJ912DRAFT_856950 [Pholiota molesta]|nr:hypothetical protein BJ912DRAFT_856950 [Pholiota molesta]
MAPSSGPIRSSPITGNPQQKAAARKRKAQRTRARTLEKQREKKRQHEEASKHMSLEKMLMFMDTHELTLWDFLAYIFNPEYGKGRTRYQQFFNTYGNASQLLNWWISSKNRSQSARAEIDEWAQDYIAKKVAKEARAVTNSRRLQTMRRNLDAGFVNSFSLPSIYNLLTAELVPISIRILRSLTTSPNVRSHGDKRKERTQTVITVVILSCLGEYSHANNLAKRIIALYLYASGAQRQVISVLSSMGICESYTNLVTRIKRRIRQGEEAPVSEQSGTLHQLSDSMRREAHQIATTGLFCVVYDNININVRSAEQIIGRHDSQENGTCATLIPLHDAKVEDLDLEDFQSRFLNACTLRLEDVLLTADELEMFHDSLIYAILRIIINYGGPGFKAFQADLDKNQPFTEDKIPITSKTRADLHPLPSWNIDKSSIVGNAEVNEAIVKELGLDSLPEASEHVRFLAGDQLSIAHLRALELIRAGQESGYPGFFWGVWIPGLFHAKIADAHGTLLTHFGKPNTGAQNPGSLWFHNTRLDRLPITTTSLPNFH